MRYAHFASPFAMILDRLAKRFDVPFTAPYTIKKITFPSFTFNAQLGGAPFPAPFVSVKLCELNPATGLPNLAAPLFQIAPYSGSPNGVNEIPINLTINDPDKVLFWAIQFPSSAALPGFPANFPFLRMDFSPLERGLFANDYSMNSAGVPDPPSAGRVSPGVLITRNLTISMTCQVASPDLSPIVPIANLGANRRLTKVDFTYSNPPDLRMDGFSLSGNSLDHANLVRRLPSGLLETSASGADRHHPGLPGWRAALVRAGGGQGRAQEPDVEHHDHWIERGRG